MELLSGTILYDKVDKSFGVLIRKYESHNVQEQEWVAYEKAFPEISFHYYENNVWESVWSKDGRVYYSEFGLLTLIETGIIIVLSNT
jgi:hypothetical protein|tara:strand:+ start:125 stop:385 length:261 start_codon:yes stop_codon:yes gene_type:complete